MQKIKQKIPIIIFLGLTITLATLLGYNTYVWISVTDLFRNLNKNTTINNIEITAHNNTTATIKINITIANPYTCTHIDIYIAIKSIIINGKTIELEDPYKGQLPGTFVAGLYVPPGSKATASFNFDVAQNSSIEENQNIIILYIRILAKTIINQEKPQTIMFTKHYPTQQT